MITRGYKVHENILFMVLTCHCNRLSVCCWECGTFMVTFGIGDRKAKKLLSTSIFLSFFILLSNTVSANFFIILLQGSHIFSGL